MLLITTYYFRATSDISIVYYEYSLLLSVAMKLARNEIHELINRGNMCGCHG